MSYCLAMIYEYTEKQSSSLLEKQIDLIADLKLNELVNTISPYRLYSEMKSADEIIRELLNAYISSSEETMFGDWLEGLAIFINQKVYSGRKSGIKGIDLEFDKDGIRYLVSIKSGPNWGNSSQIVKMEADFSSAIKTLLTSNSKMQITCVNGCCYGRDDNPNKGTFFKYCGQAFWEFIGGNENIYTDIIEPLGYKAKERNESYMEKYSQLINCFTKEFLELFCDTEGKIDWNKLVKFNSGKKV